MIGAYYFDGWTSDQLRLRITPLLNGKFAARKPIWGWKDDTVKVMQEQIDYCANYGLQFLAFDWFYPEKASVNNALRLYLDAANRDRLKFCLLVANSRNRPIGPQTWNSSCQVWINLFTRPTYLRLRGRPLLIFFSPQDLKNAFGGVEGVRSAFMFLRTRAKVVGFDGVDIAACTDPRNDWNELVRSGYTLLTGYNYHDYLEAGTNRSGPHPFSSLMGISRKIFDEFARKSPLPYIPVVTTGWDRRPWENQLPLTKRSPWYPDRTPEQVEEFVRMGIHWLNDNPNKSTKERVLLLYAWNENGEGGYLTPTRTEGTAYLEAVQRALGSHTRAGQPLNVKNRTTETSQRNVPFDNNQ